MTACAEIELVAYITIVTVIWHSQNVGRGGKASGVDTVCMFESLVVNCFKDREAPSVEM